MMTEAGSAGMLAFEQYLFESPNITISNNSAQCGTAREFFGFDKYFINDDQICEDVEQLMYSRDYYFLDEFFDQGSRRGQKECGGQEAEASPLIPPDVCEYFTPF
jgi:hypothetical protein